ncbi:alpha/beta hydrolase [Rhodoferax sp.]|uniref:alpha/beta hydrolase n=1 Tax=Rhodoferax sp. TaxID=50421 RepID=UPI00374DA524
MQQPSDAQFQYLSGQARPGFAQLLPHFEVLSALAASAGRLDIRYGEAERECFDFFAAQGTPRATLVYFHAGYWQSRDKAMFRFIAPAFTRLGLHVALVNYPLCPHVSLAHLLDAARRAVLAVDAHAQGLQPDGQSLPLLACGHSAGAHIAVELALADGSNHAVPSRSIDGVVAISGVYDLAPLLDTSLNTLLGLDADSAQRYSPLGRVGPLAPPALFAVGATETPAFLEQSQAMHAAWLGAGHGSTLQLVADTDHFTVLEQLVLTDSPLQQSVVALVDQVVAAAAAKAI